MNRKILTLAVFVAIFPALSMAASVYKWTDENGVTHFGDRKPTGQETESVDVRTGKKASGPQTSPQERLGQMEEKQANAANDEKVKAVEKAREKQRAANCETAQNNLNLLRAGSRVKVEENGEQRFLTPEEIEEKRKQFEAIAEQNCGEPENN